MKATDTGTEAGSKFPLIAKWAKWKRISNISGISLLLARGEFFSRMNESHL